MASEEKNILISVIIPAKNEKNNVSSCLDAIFNQTLKDFIEVIVIDSGSTDGTIEIISKYPVRLIQILSSEFNHGSTRNLGIAHAKGQFVVLTVMDAIPFDNKWIENMYRHFDDPKVAGVCGQQIVDKNPEKNPLEWFNPINPPSIKKIDFSETETFINFSGKEKFNLCRWDDVTAMYRREVMIEIPFRKTSFAEDMHWAKDALENGCKLIYDNHAKVIHYHHYNFKSNFRRIFTVIYNTYMIFGFIRKSDSIFTSIPLSIYRIFKQNISLKNKIKWIIYNLKLLLSNWIATNLVWFLIKVYGEKTAEKAHQYFCKKPPQPLRQNK